MKKLRNKKGFTLAELMLVVAIVVILAGVAFISVNGYTRVLRHAEYDETAREIFITAQNHLSMAYEEGYLDINDTDDYGTPEDSAVTKNYNHDLNKKVYYFVVNNPSNFASNESDKTMLDIMLPFGSIDETIRTGGAYIVRYCKDTAEVLDVFYSNKNDTKYGFTFEQLYGYNPELMNVRGEDSKETRRNYINNKVIGYFGGDSTDIEYGEEIDKPFILVKNEEKLKVIVKLDSAKDNKNTKLVLFITGEDSGTTVTTTIKTEGSYDNEFEIILDSITEESKHFANLYPSLIPGENLSIYVEASSSTVLTNIAKSATVKTNSLFGDDSTISSGETDRVAEITNFRHLENLDKNVSNLYDGLNIDRAKQTADLDWDYFLDNAESNTIYGYTNVLKTSRLYYPVNLPTNYEGVLTDEAYPVISNVTTYGNDYSGLFRVVDNKEIKNVELYNFNVSGTNAGMLAGQLTNNSKVINVLAWGANARVNASENGGGLVGISNGSTITKSAASAIVAGDNVGGLVGNATNSTISHSYSSAHVLANGSYDTVNANVGNNSSTYAGGLVGYSNSSVISNTYSTCSVKGKNAGGLVGYYNGNNRITYSYVTGYVSGSDYVGSFIGYDNTSLAHNNNHYLMVVNDYLLLTPKGMKTIGNKETNISGIEAIDNSTATYRYFVMGSAEAKPYQEFLKTAYYKNEKTRYLFRSIKEINSTGIEAYDFVNMHHGDWPSYETLIIN